jgi:uncharacterized membrane protein YeaQ/YmgE (transglycosylase-associated protein family)
LRDEVSQLSIVPAIWAVLPKQKAGSSSGADLLVLPVPDGAVQDYDATTEKFLVAPDKQCFFTLRWHGRRLSVEVPPDLWLDSRIPNFWNLHLGERLSPSAPVATLLNTESQMLGATLAGIAGALVGLYVRWVLGDKGYGVVADALLGVTGAIAANWAAGSGDMDWSARATATIWASAALPCTATLSRGVLHHTHAQRFGGKEY